MSDFGSRNMGFFGGSTTGGGGGTSTGVNGLNGTTNIGLGGTLSSNTIIDGNSGNYSLVFDNLFYFGAYTTDGWNISNNSSNRLLRIVTNLGNPSSNYISLENYKNILQAGDTCNFNIYYNSIQSLFFSTTEGALTNFGINIDFDLRKTSLGDIDNAYNKFKIIVNDLNSQLYTTTSNGFNGIFITEVENFFGQSNANYYCGFRVEQDQRITSKIGGNTTEGLSLDFLNARYTLGGIVGNNNLIEVDDGNNNITFKSGILTFTGANLETSTAPTGTIRYLVITLNGVTYQILCQKP
jgi:hypothetical protein